MPTTHNIVLVKDHRNKKYGFLKLRTITNRKPKDKSLRIKILIDNWNAQKQYVYAKEPNADEINQTIQEVLADARGGKSTIVNRKKGNKSFVMYAEKIIQVIPNRSTRRAKEDAFNKFKQYLNHINRNDIDFEEVDVFFVRGYYGWMLDSGMATSTANEYITVFGYFINQLVENGLHLYLHHPFKGLKKRKSQKKYKVLNDEELELFMDYQPQKVKTKIIKHTFMFQMYAAGMRISDALLLMWDNFNKVGDDCFVQYKTQKTGFAIQTKLTLEALYQLRLFIVEYDPDFIHDVNRLEVKKLRIEKEIKEHQDEIYGTQPSTFYRLQERYELEKELGNDPSWDTLIAREEKKEGKRSYHTTQKRYKEELLEKVDQELVELFGDKIMHLKYNHPKDTALPFLREIYEGGGVITPEVAEECHRYKVQFNQHLKKIQRKQDIKTTITNHMARHVFAQRLFLSGANIHYISMALGHSSLAITENYRELLVTDEAMDVTESFALTLNHRPYARTETITTTYKA